MATEAANKTFKETLVFELERETKNTIRYREVSEVDPPAVGTLYIQKQVLGDSPPDRLIVIVQEAQEESRHG